jgi:hypothetical protein
MATTTSEFAVVVEQALKAAGIEAVVDETRPTLLEGYFGVAPEPMKVTMRVTVYGIKTPAAPAS